MTAPGARSKRRAAALSLLVLAACGGDRGAGADGAAANAAIVEELRSLRQALAPTVDQRGLDRALEPLQQRQQALSEELSRWTTFLALSGRAPGVPIVPVLPMAPAPGHWPVGPVPGEGATPGAAPAQPGSQARSGDPGLMARLDEIERLLRDNGQRQRDLETAVAGALDATTRQVDALLGQLQAMPRATTPAITAPTAADPIAGAQPTDAVVTAVPDAPATAAPASAGPAPDAAATGPPEQPAADDGFVSDAALRESLFSRERAKLHQGWLIAVLAVGLGAIVFLGWRLLRQSAPPALEPEVREASPGDMTTDELWAAAGLLSEAVGRLRGAVPSEQAAAAQTAMAGDRSEPAAEPDAETPAPADVARVEAPTPVPGAEVGEVFVLEDEDDLLAQVDWRSAAAVVETSEAPAPIQPPVAPPTEASAPASAPTPAPAARVTPGPRPAAAPQAMPVPPTANGHSNGRAPGSAPEPWSVRLEARDHVMARATIDAYLQHDPRVLRQPAPVVRSTGDGLLVECALLPGLMPGEREHLRATLQRLMTQV